MKNAQKTIHIITTEKGIISEYDNLCLTLNKAKERGIIIRILVPQTKKTTGLAKEITKFGQIKHTDKELGRLFIVDGKILNIFVEENSESCIWMNSSFVANSFENIFMKLWSSH